MDGCASMDRWAWAPLPPVVGQLPAGSSAFLVPVSLLDFLPGPRVCFCNCWCMVFGMFVGGCFLFGFCYLPFVVVALASFLAAHMFCGFRAGRLEKCTTSEGFIRSLESWNQGQAYSGPWVTCYRSLWACVSVILSPGRGLEIRQWMGQADKWKGFVEVFNLSPLCCCKRNVSWIHVVRLHFLVSSKETTWIDSV